MEESLTVVNRLLVNAIHEACIVQPWEQITGAAVETPGLITVKIHNNVDFSDRCAHLVVTSVAEDGGQ